MSLRSYGNRQVFKFFLYPNLFVMKTTIHFIKSPHNHALPLLLLGLLLCCAGLAKAQSSLHIRGTIQDETGPLPIATVVLKQAADSSVVKTGVTNNQGVFDLAAVQPGKYRLSVKFVGMDSYTSKVIKLENISVTLPPITLKESAEALEEVTIEAEKPIIEVRADKTVFNVESTIGAAGSDGFELLRKAPGVLIDNNNSIIVEGKSGVQIFINGKPTPLSGDDLINFLKSLQATDIEAVEIITQPSSKYDAAGNAGIINIKLKKNKGLGTNGTATLGYAYGKNSRYNGSLNLNHRGKGVNVYGSYSGRTGESWRFLDLDRFQEGIRYNSQNESLSDWTSHNARAGADFFLNDKHTIGVLASGNFRDYYAENNTTTPISEDGEILQVLRSNSNKDGQNQNIQANLNYRYSDTLGYELGVDLDYGTFNRDRTTFQPNQYSDGETGAVLTSQDYQMVMPTDIAITSAKVDYSQNLMGGKLSAGLKYSNVVTDNVFEFYDFAGGAPVLNGERSNEFEYTEQIQAAYANFNTKLSKKWKFQAGLRVERTISEGNLTTTQQIENKNVKRDYTNLFPSGGLTFIPNRSNSFSLTYSRRIQRPNYQSLNPFENQLNELSIRRGNPFLQPQYTDNIKLSHTFKYRFTTSVSYSYTQDFFAQITDAEENGRSVMMAQNIANRRVWNANFSAPFGVAKWWEVYASLNLGSSTYEGSNEKFNPIERATFNMYAQNTFSLPYGLKLEVSGWFNSPSVWGGTYLTESMGSLNMAVQKKFMDDKLSLRVSVNDIFFTSYWRANMQYGDLRINGSGGRESRQVRINLSYTFGNGEVKRARKRKTGIEEEGSRVGE